MSRLLFAIDDLAVELDRLGVEESDVRLVLSPKLYEAAKADIGHHLGRPLEKDEKLIVGRIVLCQK